jgi:hypothetical protein
MNHVNRWQPQGNPYPIAQTVTSVGIASLTSSHWKSRLLATSGSPLVISLQIVASPHTTMIYALTARMICINSATSMVTCPPESLPYSNLLVYHIPLTLIALLYLRPSLTESTSLHCYALATCLILLITCFPNQPDGLGSPNPDR